MANPLSLLSGLWLGACSVVGIRGVEEPAYTVRERIGAVEIREYAGRLAAETSVTASSEEAARGIGFRRVAGYIFGGNHAGRKIEMTAPVTQAPAGGRDIAMTAPVAQLPGADGAWTIHFFMPASFTMESLPVPNDPLVRLVTLPAETCAVTRFSGVAGAEAVAAKTQVVRDALAGTRWRIQGAPFAWFYDPPWTLPPLRRNEVGLDVRPG